MNYQLFESFREWVPSTRRRKDSKKPSKPYTFEGARASCSHDGDYKTVSGEIIEYLEPPNGEFNSEQRSPETSWFNIKQLTEPQLTAGELISTRQI